MTECLTAGQIAGRVIIAIFILIIIVILIIPIFFVVAIYLLIMALIAVIFFAVTIIYLAFAWAFGATNEYTDKDGNYHITTKGGGVQFTTGDEIFHFSAGK